MNCAASMKTTPLAKSRRQADPIDLPSSGSGSDALPAFLGILLRRAVKGKGLYFINSVVDLVNYFSLKMLWPMGLYDADKLKPPITWRIGQEGETYEGIGRDRLNLANFPLLVDQEGPFGSPISDSMRTRVTGECTRILWITSPRRAQVFRRMSLPKR